MGRVSIFVLALAFVLAGCQHGTDVNVTDSGDVADGCDGGDNGLPPGDGGQTSGCVGASCAAPDAGPPLLGDRLTVRGHVCTQKPDTDGFPVKVLFLIDSSATMCINDPPGSESSAGFCENAISHMGNHGYALPDSPVRVSALTAAMKAFAKSPTTSVALLPFNEETRGYPANGFVSPTQLFAPIAYLQNQLSKASDLQGALTAALSWIESDAHKQPKAFLPRTRYVVVLLTDGVPFPRCAAYDGLPASEYASANAPSGIWPDVSWIQDRPREEGSDAGPPPGEFCNSAEANRDTTGAPIIAGFVAGTDRNQNYQLFDLVDRIVALQGRYNLGGVSFNTVNVYNATANQACGAICTSEKNPMPAAGAWLLKALASRGNGIYAELKPDTGFDAVDFSSLFSPYVSKSLFASNVFAFPSATGTQLDSDGDGVRDMGEQTAGTSPTNADTDGDGFSDGFEIAHAAEGFDPLVPDPRGCKSTPNIVPRYTCRDADGDVLTAAAEAYLGTDPMLPDSDGDGIPDGVEVAMGLNALVPNTLTDQDHDGVLDLDEVAAHTNPLGGPDSDAYRTQVNGETQADGTVCYDFTISNIRLMDGPLSLFTPGRNYVTVTFGQAPQKALMTDYGEWRQACLLVKPAAEGVLGPEVSLSESDFLPLTSFMRTSSSPVPANRDDACRWVP